jgi:hypothetical protein
MRWRTERGSSASSTGPAHVTPSPGAPSPDGRARKALKATGTIVLVAKCIAASTRCRMSRGTTNGTPNGIRTRAATLKGWCPRPLDDGGQYYLHLLQLRWSGCRDLNPGPLRPERSALPSCATARGEFPRSPLILLVARAAKNATGGPDRLRSPVEDIQ